MVQQSLKISERRLINYFNHQVLWLIKSRGRMGCACGMPVTHKGEMLTTFWWVKQKETCHLVEKM